MPIITPNVSSPREAFQVLQDIILDKDTLVEIQKGFYDQPRFFGNHQSGSAFSGFTGAIAGAQNFSGFADILKTTLIDQISEKTPKGVTKTQYSNLVKRAGLIGIQKGVPTDAVEDFLSIIVSIDDIGVMQTIAEATDIPELAAIGNLLNVDEILNIPGLEKIAYMASATQSLIKGFDKFPGVISNLMQGGDDIESIFSSLSSLLGGFSGDFKQILDTSAPDNAIGSLMSELVTGKRIPMTIIAKNPQLQSPSFVGKAFFGESMNSLSNIDINQVFPKKIGVFPKPSSGGATSSFGLANFNTFADISNVKDLVSKVMFGTTKEATGSKQTLLNNALDIVNSVVGATSSELIDTKRADNVIPMMAGLSAVFSGTDKAPFSIDTFQQSWVAAMSATNYMQSNANVALDAIKKLV